VQGAGNCILKSEEKIVWSHRFGKGGVFLIYVTNALCARYLTNLNSFNAQENPTDPHSTVEDLEGQVTGSKWRTQVLSQAVGPAASFQGWGWA
jgi:hypothetical protein